jgi:hypothetical protein
MSREFPGAVQVCERLPVVDMQWTLNADGKSGTAAPNPANEAGVPQQMLEVRLTRRGARKSGPGLARVYAPRFPKV